MKFTHAAIAAALHSMTQPASARLAAIGEKSMRNLEVAIDSRVTFREHDRIGEAELARKRYDALVASVRAV